MTDTSELHNERGKHFKFPPQLLQARLDLLPNASAAFDASIDASGILREPEQLQPVPVIEAADKFSVEPASTSVISPGVQSLDPETVPLDLDEARRAVEDARNAA